MMAAASAFTSLRRLGFRRGLEGRFLTLGKKKGGECFMMLFSRLLWMSRSSEGAS